MTNFSIDPETMKHVVAKAILDNIGAEDRDRLVTDALTYLVTVPKSVYGDASGAPSPLQAAFNDAIRRAAFKVVEELLAQPEYADRINSAIRDAVAKALADSAGLSSAIGFAVGEVIEKRVREWA